jgi:hypothetical protein
LNRIAGGFVAATIVINIGVFELDGAQMVYYSKHQLPPQAGRILQYPQKMPDSITVASSGMVAIVDWVVNG